jgi:phosphoenolpyruvate carboxykinase (GTP)
VPLVLQSFNWTHGVYLGSTMGSETTAAQTGAVGVVRRDPMAMLPFIGYDAGTYLHHWLDIHHRIPSPPKLFLVNWFRKGPDGKFLWPGYGDNMRVLKWILDRCKGSVAGRETLLGWTPREGDLDLRGLDAPAESVAAATRVDLTEWEAELESQAEWFRSLGPTLPAELEMQRQLLLASVKGALRAGAH